MKEKLLKAIVLLMAGVIVFGSTTLIFSAAEIPSEKPTTSTTASTEATEATEATEPSSESLTSGNDDASSEPASDDEDGSDVTITSFKDGPKPSSTSPTSSTKKASSTKKTSSTKKNNAGSISTTVAEETTTEEITFDYENATVYTFEQEEEETEAEKEKKSLKDFFKNINFGTVAIVFVIIIAVIGAAVCLIILGKKR